MKLRNNAAARVHYVAMAREAEAEREIKDALIDNEYPLPHEEAEISARLERDTMAEYRAALEKDAIENYKDKVGI